MKIVAAYDKTKSEIERMSEKVMRANDAFGGRQNNEDEE